MNLNKSCRYPYGSIKKILQTSHMVGIRIMRSRQRENCLVGANTRENRLRQRQVLNRFIFPCLWHALAGPVQAARGASCSATQGPCYSLYDKLFGIRPRVTNRMNVCGRGITANAVRATELQLMVRRQLAVTLVHSIDVCFCQKECTLMYADVRTYRKRRWFKYSYGIDQSWQKHAER